MSFLDLDERLIDLAGLVDVCYSPVADTKEFPENVDIVLVEGAVANEDNLREIRHIRERSKILVAFGDCAVTGNVTALRNLFKLDDVLNRSYKENSAVISGLPLGGDGIVPKLLDRVLRIQDVVPVDHYLPGCPPSADAIFSFVTELLAGHTPAPVGRKFGT
jgi:NAD-reducing hydrogenase small subunit